MLGLELEHSKTLMMFRRQSCLKHLYKQPIVSHSDLCCLSDLAANSRAQFVQCKVRIKALHFNLKLQKNTSSL